MLHSFVFVVDQNLLGVCELMTHPVISGITSVFLKSGLQASLHLAVQTARDPFSGYVLMR